MTTDQPTEPAIEIDYREVARLARESFVRDPLTCAIADYRGIERFLRAQADYLASRGVTPAEDPRDAEIRSLSSALDIAHRNIVRVSREADDWRALCEKLQHRIREIQEAPKPAEAAPSGRFSYQPESEDELGSISENGKTLVILEESDDESHDVGAKRIVRLLNSKPKPAEPTREQRLAAWARETQALGFYAYVSRENEVVFINQPINDAEAAAVRAALGEA